ncbi:MAG TPA: hypothetical protein VGQ42_01810 [Candidatus Dormibacteraeota bacterium]|jgi:hypothetical protein|nr:hypothetical protein [Candidatus Dormibacteraeota bacterium]
MTWRDLPSPHPPVEAFVAEAWHRTTACQVDDDTLELRVHWPPGQVEHHLVRDVARHRWRGVIPPAPARR